MTSVGTCISLFVGSFLLCSTFVAGEIWLDRYNFGHTKKLQFEEGKDLAVSCHDSESSWTGPNGFSSNNQWMNITKVSRTDSGLYKCTSRALGNLLSIELDVTYPPRIISITIPKHLLSMREDFQMTVEVDGNPPPKTQLTFVPEDKVVFSKIGNGTFNIVLKNMNCTDGGIYELTCNNSVGLKKVAENVTIANKPGLDPLFLPNQRIFPRLGDNVNFTAHVISCPPVLFFEWSHDSKPAKNHEDANSTSVLFLDDVNFDTYGSYQLKMRNSQGDATIQYFAEAFGPPAAISDLDVSDVTANSANISFMSGFDYNDTQTFMVMREMNGHLKSLRNITDGKHDTGRLTSFVITDLDEITSYNITVIAHNTRGNSAPESNFVEFQTYGSPKPDPKYPLHHTTAPRLGGEANFTIHCLSDPEPTFLWLHAGKHVKSLDSNTTCGSTITVDKIVVDDFGFYLLEMQNEYGESNVSFEIVAEGPPEPISDLMVSDVSENSANISFMSGFDYNDTQTFLVMREIDGELKSLKNVTSKPNDKGRHTSIVIKQLSETTTYNITVISQNARGKSTPESSYVAFETFGSPKPDPSYPINNKTTPRLGDVVEFAVHCVGNPEPSFTWIHDGKHLKSVDSNITCGSTLVVDKIEADDFGSYLLEMENPYGEFNVSFDMIPDGPPAPVSDLKVIDISASAATIIFTTGYNYNKTQVFIVKQKSGTKQRDMTTCNDTTDGKGGAAFSCKIENLKTYTKYEVTVVSKNSAGESIPTTGFIDFYTFGAPKPDPKYPVSNTSEPRVGDIVKLSVRAIGYPEPTFKWIHDGKIYNSSDKGYTSTLELSDMEVEDFGHFIVNVSNPAGSYESTFTLIPEGPPDAVSHLKIADVSTSSASVQFTTGYNYEDKQIFIVMHNDDGHFEVMATCNDTTNGKGGAPFSCKLDKLKQDTLYNVTVVSENSKGESNTTTEFIQFSTYGSPKPNPKFPVTDKFKPRLGQAVTLTVHAIGYPEPTYVWMHDGNKVKSEDSGYTSTVDFGDMSVDDFGNYTVNISNAAGSYTTEFAIIADGPPAPVSNLIVGNWTDHSVSLQWTAGFNYGSKQDFRIFQLEQNGVDTELDDVKDITNGKGGQVEHSDLKNLASDTTYKVYLVAGNSRGNATKSNVVSFTTAAPSGSGLSAAAVAGIVIGSLAVLVLVAVVIAVVRRRRQSAYEQFDTERKHPRYDE